LTNNPLVWAHYEMNSDVTVLLQ